MGYKVCNRDLSFHVFALKKAMSYDKERRILL